MLIHSVLFWLKENLTEEDRSEFFDGVEVRLEDALQGHVVVDRRVDKLLEVIKRVHRRELAIANSGRHGRCLGARGRRGVGRARERRERVRGAERGAERGWVVIARRPSR